MKKIVGVVLAAVLVCAPVSAQEIPEETAQPCIWIVSADECTDIGTPPMLETPVATAAPTVIAPVYETPVYDEPAVEEDVVIYELPSTGSGATA